MINELLEAQRVEPIELAIKCKELEAENKHKKIMVMMNVESGRSLLILLVYNELISSIL